MWNNFSLSPSVPEYIITWIHYKSLFLFECTSKHLRNSFFKFKGPNTAVLYGFFFSMYGLTRSSAAPSLGFLLTLIKQKTTVLQAFGNQMAHIFIFIFLSLKCIIGWHLGCVKGSYEDVIHGHSVSPTLQNSFGWVHLSRWLLLVDKSICAKMCGSAGGSLNLCVSCEAPHCQVKKNSW